MTADLLTFGAFIAIFVGVFALIVLWPAADRKDRK